MPMIQLTLPAGVLTAATRQTLQKTLAATLLKWEGAPDTAFFRALAWSRIDEVPTGAQVPIDHESRRLTAASVATLGVSRRERVYERPRQRAGRFLERSRHRIHHRSGTSWTRGSAAASGGRDRPPH